MQEDSVKIYGAEVIVKINGTIEKIKANMVFYSQNPKTNRYCVNLRYTECGKEKWVQVFCQDVYEREPAKELNASICEGKITDLTGYMAERRM